MLQVQAAPPIGETITLFNVAIGNEGAGEGFVILEDPTLTANGNSIGEAQQFIVGDADGSGINITLQIPGGNYIQVNQGSNDRLQNIATATTNTLTHFKWVTNAFANPDSIALQCVGNGDYVGIGGNADQLRANDGSLQSDDEFTFGIVGGSIEVPQNLTAVATDSQVVLDWDDDLTGTLNFYTMYRSTSSPVTINDTVVGNPTDSTITDTSVINGITYYYAVNATDTEGTTTALSEEVSATPPTGTVQPTGFTAIDAPSSCKLDWDDDPTGHLEFYTVYRSLSAGVTTNDLAVTNVMASAFVDNDVSIGTTYYYAVSATGSNGVESALSAEDSATPFELEVGADLLMHYDASIVSSVTTETNGLVQTWANQASPGTYDATVSQSGVLYPSANLSATGIAGLDFTTNAATVLELMSSGESTNLLDLTSGQNGLVYIIALRPEGASTQQDIMGNNGTTGNNFDLRWTGGSFRTWLGSADSGILNTTATTGDTLVVSGRYDATTEEYTVWESASLNTDTSTVALDDFSNGDPINLGKATSNTRNFQGVIFELKIWRSTLDDSTLEAERNAMVAKWVAGAGYDAWAGSWGGIDIGASNNDYDNDGIFNIYEYGLDGDPTNMTVEPAVLPVIVNNGGSLEYIHIRRNNDPSLSYSIETTTDLVIGQWTNVGVTATATNLGAGFFDTVTNAVDSSVDERFIRLIIEN